MLKSCLLAFAITATLGAQKPTLRDLDQKINRILQILEEADSTPAPVAPKSVNVDVQGAPALGLESAPVTVVEFTDFQCPFCSKFHTETFPKLHDEFIATGKIRFVSRDLPLPMHQNALTAALAGRCAGEQGHFWEMRDWMQSNPTKLEELQLFAHAMDLDLDLEQYRKCMSTDKYKSSIDADATEARKNNITGTPSFVIGKSGPTIEGELIVGAQPLASFEARLKDLLK